MKSVWNRYYDVTKRFLSVTGQWPHETKRNRILRTSVIMCAALVINVPQVCKFIHCNEDLECVVGAMPSYLLVILIMMKVCLYQLKNSKIKILTERMMDDWENLQNPEEREIMRTYAIGARWLVVIYIGICAGGVFIFVLVALIPQILDIVLPLNESRPIMLPFEAYFFVDEREYFFYIFSYGFIAGMIAITGLIGHDIMFMTCVEHVCGTFAVAGFRFEHSVCENIDIMRTVHNNTYQRRMAYCINAHRSALEFAEFLENIYTVNFGLELIMVTITVSVTLFQITVQSGDSIEAIRYIVYVLALLFHLFVFCWEGQKLMDHSLQICDKIYSCSWYNIPAKSQRLILHVIKRSMRPNILSASRIFVFSLQGYTTVLQTSMSYFTVLSSVR